MYDPNKDLIRRERGIHASKSVAKWKVELGYAITILTALFVAYSFIVVVGTLLGAE